MKQKTIKKDIIFSGIGLHSGLNVNLRLKPNFDCTGIIFKRTDKKNDIIFAKYNNVVDTKLGTTISNGVNKVLTIEHLMAALWGCDIDNVIIEIDNQETLILDGSSVEFTKKIEEIGTIELEKDRHYLKIVNPIEIVDDNKYIKILPDNKFNVSITVDFNYGNIGKQTFDFNGDKNIFLSEIANARTFCNVKEIDYMKSIGLARGGTLDNAIVFDEKNVINKDGLRYKDEVVRHKLLDCLGDFYTSGYNIIGKIISFKGGHTINNIALRKIFDDTNNYEIIN